ncbi:MAG: SAM-dependent methyltransferase, partial [Bacteroidaceae bacterium]|nr:SAM-dependent methyltransferase [Bacteroidaceae bacterium]
MLDLFQAVQKLESVCQIHVVAVRNECKELLLILSKDGRNIAADDIPIQTFNISADGSVQNYASTISKEQESDC